MYGMENIEDRVLNEATRFLSYLREYRGQSVKRGYEVFILFKRMFSFIWINFLETINHHGRCTGFFRFFYLEIFKLIIFNFSNFQSFLVLYIFQQIVLNLSFLCTVLVEDPPKVTDGHRRFEACFSIFDVFKL